MSPVQFFSFTPCVYTQNAQNVMATSSMYEKNEKKIDPPPLLPFRGPLFGSKSLFLLFARWQGLCDHCAHTWAPETAGVK